MCMNGLCWYAEMIFTTQGNCLYFNLNQIHITKRKPPKLFKESKRLHRNEHNLPFPEDSTTAASILRLKFLLLTYVGDRLT